MHIYDNLHLKSKKLQWYDSWVLAPDWQDNLVSLNKNWELRDRNWSLTHIFLPISGREMKP